MKRYRTPTLEVRTVKIACESDDKALLKLCSAIRRAKSIDLESIGRAVDSIMLAMGYERATEDVEQDWAVCWSENEWHLDWLYRRTGMTEGLYIGFGLYGYHVMPLNVDLYYEHLTTDEVAALKWSRLSVGKTWVADDYGRYYISDENPTSWLAKVVKAMKSRGKTISSKSEADNKNNNALSVRYVFLVPIKHPEEIGDLCAALGSCQCDDAHQDDLRDAVKTLMRGFGYLNTDEVRFERDEWASLWRDRLNLLFRDVDGKYAGIVDCGDGLRPYWVEFGSETLEPKYVAGYDWHRTEGDRWVAYGRLNRHYIADIDPKQWLAEHAKVCRSGGGSGSGI